MTRVVRVVLVVAALVVFGVSVSASSARSSFVIHRVVFVGMTGQGTVTSRPIGLKCPALCRSNVFIKDHTVQLVAKPAAGWQFAQWGGGWCTGTDATCTFALTDSHDCSGGMCPLGAFGVRVTFTRLSPSG